jgi:NADPH:quinone reductase-like Zn-dependent oxidoreductase
MAGAMKAIVYKKYGPPGVLKLEDIPKPTPGDNQVLVRIHATTVGMWDCESRSFTFPLWLWLPLRIAMGLRKPRWPVLGQELAGEIEAVGKNVMRFKSGDQVFASVGLGFGAHAEYKCLSSKGPIAIKPANMSYEQAAGIPVGGDNALHFLRAADIQDGESVLVNGAGGNIGVMAVQIAKHFGADVTAVDSTEKLDMLNAIGADHVIDYTKADFTQSGQRYDVIFGLVFKSAYSRCVRSVKPNGRYLLANPSLFSMIRGRWTSLTSNKKVVSKFASSKPEDLIALKALAEAGKIRAVIDKRYPLERAAEAHAYVDTGRRKGTVVLTVET